MRITKRFGHRAFVLMTSILLIGAGSVFSETDEPGPFQRLFRALRQGGDESHHKSKTQPSVHKQQQQRTETESTSDTEPNSHATTGSSTNKPPSDRNTRGATRASGKKEKGLAYGKPVPGKTGLVTSPYSPEAGYIDVRGFAPGTPVKDPYSGKIFLTP